MAINEILGRRHIRYTRTVKREVQGRGMTIDLVLEAYFPLDFCPEHHQLDLVNSKEGGVVTVQLSGDVTPLEILNAGAVVVALTNPATPSTWLDLDAELQGQMTEERAVEIVGEMLTPQVAPEPSARASLMGGAATKPLRRI